MGFGVCNSAKTISFVEKANKSYHVYKVIFVLHKYTLQKKSVQLGFWVNSVLTVNGCILCYLSLFTEIISQQKN